jgi:hypothetical protein
VSRAEGPVAASWDAEYSAGRYTGAEPLPFVRDILACAGRFDLPAEPGLYIGCGNGRNYLPLLDGCLDLVGLDVSAVALSQLTARAAAVAPRLVHGDLSALPAGEAFSVVVGIQVFQHGDEAEAQAHVVEAAVRVLPGGLFCLRVNAAATDVDLRLRVLERNADGGFSVEYLEGPKAGLTVHFFAEAELARLLDAFEPVLAPRLDTTRRVPPRSGGWSQWEGIWRRRPADVDFTDARSSYG